MSKIYVNTYAKYNNGQSGGDWLDAEDYSDHDDFMVACKELHADEEDPEIMFSDYEYFPAEFYGESEIDSRLWDWLALDDNEREIVEAWLSENSLGKQEDLQSIVDSYTGQYDSWEDYAWEITNERHNIPKHLEYYIDYDKMGRDMMIESRGYVEYNGKIWLFEG